LVAGGKLSGHGGACGDVELVFGTLKFISGAWFRQVLSVNEPRRLVDLKGIYGSSNGSGRGAAVQRCRQYALLRAITGYPFSCERSYPEIVDTAGEQAPFVSPMSLRGTGGSR
jgi:hypothetical protein